MKDEIKLKDMIDFLEDIYKDIKKQPTLEEELEKEREFINKIKGNNKDEINEMLDDLRNKNSYINDETILTFDEAKLLLDYITNLQAIEQEHQRINGELREENKRLRETNKIFSERIISESNPDYFQLREENKRLREQLEAKD